MLVIAVVNPTSLALLVPPGEWGDNGVDIVVGEGQPLGIPLSSGGPYFGFMCCKQQHVRQMPGRIIGRTVDLEQITKQVSLCGLGLKFQLHLQVVNLVSSIIRVVNIGEALPMQKIL